MRKIFYFGLWFLLCGVFELKASYDLDNVILKERLKKIYGEFSIKAKGDWQVSFDGKIVTWKWSEKGWTCPQDPKVSCKEWIPTSFKWWVENRGWLERWTPNAKLGFEFGKTKREPAMDRAAVASSPHEESDPSAVEHAAERSEDRDGFAGKNWASEVWEWKSTKGESSRVYTSLRDQRIERIDYGENVEFVEWQDKPGRSSLDLVRVTMERGGARLVFSKVSK